VERLYFIRSLFHLLVMSDLLMIDEKEQVKQMADLLMSGATMLFEHCPQCGAPLFKIHGEVWCQKCNKKVLIIKEEQEIPDYSHITLLNDLEKTILSKLQEVHLQIKAETDLPRLATLGNFLSTWLEILEKVRNIQKV
jgi:uncharacterized Zn finger protein (UPF0148 family)